MFSLVVMAAGIGSRFGGTKQLAEVGPDGEAFLDFAILDGCAAGASSVVLVVRRDIEADVRRHVERRHGHVDVTYVRQDEHGPPRSKPWGTGHAVLAAGAAVDGPFVACNADDYYGPTTYTALAQQLANMARDEALLAGFRLDLTLPDHGSVSRGICTIDDDARLTEVVEHHGIARRADGVIEATEPHRVLHGDTTASMNLWAFPPVMLDWLDVEFDRFLFEQQHGGSPLDESVEFQLPSVVSAKMQDGSLHVGVVPTAEAWIGVTNPDDLIVARRMIAEQRPR